MRKAHKTVRVVAALVAALLSVAGWAQAEEITIALSNLSTFQKDTVTTTVRGAVAIPAIPKGDSIHIDYAELIFPASAEVDTADPLLIMVAPITRQWTPGAVSWNTGWTKAGGDFNPEYGALRAIFASTTEKEIRVDVTPLVTAWQRGKLPNFGVLVKSHTEGKSSFGFIKDGRYDGGHAKLRIVYCRP